MSWRLALCVVLGSCGFSSSAQPRDAAGDGSPIDTPIDAPIDAQPSDGDCLRHWLDHTVQFSTVDRLMQLASSGDDRDPWIAPNGKLLYFASHRNGNNDIFSATRGDVAQEFANPQRNDDLSTSQHNEERPSLSADQKLIALSSESGPADRALILMTESPTADTFGPPNDDHLSNVNAANADQRDPFLSVDGLRLYLSVDPQGAPKSQIVVAARSARNADFALPQPVPGINEGSDNADPALSVDERILLFTSSRAGGGGGGGGDDLWYATRQDTNHPFGAPVPVPTVNSGSADGDPMLSADGCELYFASTRGRLDYDLYVARVVR